MLTLEEAVAELDKLLAFGWIEDRVGTRVNADEIRAAVRDVALAVWYATVAPPSNSLSMAVVAENIDRLFPKEADPHG